MPRQSVDCVTNVRVDEPPLSVGLDDPVKIHIVAIKRHVNCIFPGLWPIIMVQFPFLVDAFMFSLVVARAKIYISSAVEQRETRP
jgi:hypothetical protein